MASSLISAESYRANQRWTPASSCSARCRGLSYAYDDRYARRTKSPRLCGDVSAHLDQLSHSAALDQQVPCVWSRRGRVAGASAAHERGRFKAEIRLRVWQARPRSASAARSSHTLRKRGCCSASNDPPLGTLPPRRENRLKLLLADPRCDELRRLHALLRRLEETERAEDAVAGIDQVVALEPGQLRRASARGSR